ncbi:YceG family protein [Solibacillus sp. FSL H8-0538]|uniref:YceG family protein n=1 Tax=Solibacillus sp. FSL H8-0538 TaxID=2921400 RepID=UPI0030F929AA
MLFKPQNFEETALQHWEEMIALKLSMRPIFLKGNGELLHTRVAIQLLGIEDNEYEAQEYIYAITNKGINWTLLFDNMPKLISPQKRTEIVNILQIHQVNPLSINRFMAFFAGKQLLPLMNSPYRDHFAQTLRKWLEFLEQRFPRLQSNLMQRILLDFVKWSNHYFPEWLQESPFEVEMPKIFWYGPAKESEVYFLYFLYLFGCDIVVVEPNGEDIFTSYGIQDFPTKQLATTTEVFDFPYDKPIRVQTITSRASEQVSQQLYTNPALNYPWKYADYETRTRILNTTYDELFILSDAQLYLRDGFTDEDDTVYLPVLFAKIEGVSLNRQDYVTKIKYLHDQKTTYTATTFPLLPLQKGNMQFHMRDASTNGQLDIEKMIRLSVWPFKNLQLGAQRNVARTIIRLIESGYIQLLPQESKKKYETYLFGQLLLIPDEVIRLYQQFDYSYLNPTFLVFKEEESGQMQRQDAILLMFLSMLGFDVIICSPGGSLSIEHFIAGELLDTHRLEKISFDEKLSDVLHVQIAQGEPERKLDLKTMFRRISKKLK